MSRQVVMERLMEIRELLSDANRSTGDLAFRLWEAEEPVWERFLPVWDQCLVALESVSALERAVADFEGCLPG